MATEPILEAIAAGRELLRSAIGDDLVDAPSDFCWLMARDGQLDEARFRGGYIPQYLLWLAERPQPTLRTLVLEQSSMFDWNPMVQQLTNLDAPALTTLVFGGPAGAGARFLILKSVPAGLLPQLEHLSVQARIPSETLAELTNLPNLRTLTLELEPKAPPLDVSALTQALGAMPHLESLHLFGPIDTDSASQLFEGAPEHVKHLEIDVLGGERLVRTTPDRTRLREAMGHLPGADAWWTGELPTGTHLVVAQAGDAVTYTAELPNTRALGRRTTVASAARIDAQLWHGRLQGMEVTTRGGQRIVRHCERGVPHQIDIYDATGKLTERRFLENGRVVRTEKDAAPPPAPGPRLELSFTGKSTEALEVLGSTRYDSPDSAPVDIARALLDTYGRHAEEATLAAVWELTDDGAFTAYRCKMVDTGEPLSIVAAHFGDTFAGVGLRDGHVVAELNDAYLVGLG